MNDKYPDSGVNAITLCGTNQVKVMNVTKTVLLSEARDRSINLSIKDIVIHIYPCKCLYSITGYINNNSFDIIGNEKTTIDAYRSIRGQIFGKYLR